jgi:hypothetical protein
MAKGAIIVNVNFSACPAQPAGVKSTANQAQKEQNSTHVR